MHGSYRKLKSFFKDQIYFSRTRCGMYTEVLDIPLRPYKEAEERTQQIMRAKTTDLIQDTAGKFVHFKPHDIPDFAHDLVGS